MRKFPLSSKGVFLFLTLSSAIFLMSGCQKAFSNMPSALKTAQGIPLEMLLPKDSGLVVEVGTNDTAQLNNLDLIAKNFPSGNATGTQGLKDQLFKSFDKVLSVYGLTYATDLKPVLGDKVHFMLGMNNFPQTRSSGVAQGSLNMELVVPLLDSGKVDELAQKFAGRGDILQDNYRGINFFQKGGTKMFITRLGDALVVTNSLDGLKSTIDRYQDVSASLLDNDFYQKSLAQMSSNVGFIFMDPKSISPAMYGDSQAVSQVGGGSTGSQAGAQAATSYPDEEKYFQALQGMYYAFSAEPNGLRISGQEFGDAQVLKNNKVNFLTLPHSNPYLYQKVPSDKALLYFENSDLKSLLNIELAVFEKMYKVADFKGKMQQFFASRGLDFDKDVLSFLDKGSSFVWRDSGNFMPNLAFYVDASSNPAGAQKTVNALHTLLQQVITQLGQKYKSIVQGFVFEDVPLVDGSMVHVLRFKPENLDSKSSSIFTQLLMNTPLELWYGVSKDNLAFVALYPHFDQDFEANAKTLADDADFKDTQAALGKSLSSFVYLSPNIIAQYISHFGDIGAAMGVAPSNSAQVKADQLVLESYVKPFKGIIFNSKAVSPSEIDFTGYVLVKGQ